LLHTKFEVFSISQSCPRAISIRKKKIKKEENTNKEEKAQKEELKDLLCHIQEDIEDIKKRYRISEN